MAYGIVVAILGLLILIHELGHLAAAKWAKIPIERFSVGFGPKLWGFKKGGTEYWFALVPLGGYVLPQVREAEEFSLFPLSKRVLFCLGGPTANVMAALLCLSVSDSVTSGVSWSSTVTRPLSELCTAAVQVISAIPIACKHPDKLSGIVGIVAFGGQHVGIDIARMFSFCALLNTNLAVLNMLPIPALDGGRIVFFLLERIYRPLTRLQIPVAIAGWVFLLMLMLYATVTDVRHLLS